MVDRYATNQFLGFQDYEAGVFGKGVKSQTVQGGDNPDFIYPGKNYRNAVAGSSQPMRRGYMRMLSQGFEGGTSLSKKRLHFQFNPDILVRNVTARNDVQLWMNQDPVQLMQPIPGDANFSFELLFNREAEVSSGMYRAGSDLRPSTAKANLPLQGAGSKTKAKSLNIPHSSVTDIGVLADLMVFDEIIGQGINTQLIDKVIKNAQGINAAQINAYYKGAESNEPKKPAQATVKTVNSSGGITAIDLKSGGEGYVLSPDITIKSKATDASGAVLKATVAGGKVTEVLVQTAGTKYKVGDGLTFTGGGTATSTSADSTGDAEDKAPIEFDAKDAYATLYNNYGNSSFLVSLPVRIVFSSLFMVEGFITSTMVTFNKFNASMVPTQCAVAVTMQALYIGFARKDTFLTTTLETALKDSKEALKDASATTTETTEVKIAKEVGEKLFWRIQEWGGGSKSRWWKQIPVIGGGNTQYTGLLSPSVWFEDDDRQNRDYLGFQIDATQTLKNLLKTERVSKVTATAEWSAIYRGNSNSSTQTSYLASPNSFDLDEEVYNLVATTDIDKDGLTQGGDSILFEFVFDGDNFYKTPDKSATSKYDTKVTVTFTVVTSSGSTPAKQYLESVFTGKHYTEDIRIQNSYKFYPQVTSKS